MALVAHRGADPLPASGALQAEELMHRSHVRTGRKTAPIASGASPTGAARGKIRLDLRTKPDPTLTISTITTNEAIASARTNPSTPSVPAPDEMNRHALLRVERAGATGNRIRPVASVSTKTATSSGGTSGEGTSHGRTPRHPRYGGPTGEHPLAGSLRAAEAGAIRPGLLFSAAD